MSAVPASINKGLSSGNVTVQEGRDITITCSVFGIPRPEVTWYRHAGTGPLNYAADKQCHMVTGMQKKVTAGESRDAFLMLEMLTC